MYNDKKYNSFLIFENLIIWNIKEVKKKEKKNQKWF